jgi:hypothetical protein
MRLPLLFVIAALSASACGGGSGGDAPVIALPTASLDASSTAIDAGGSATLTWSSANATSCTASGGWSGTLAAAGSRSTGALGNDTTFSLTCTGTGGTSRTASVAIVVNDPPTAALTANPVSVTAGNASMLTWSSAHATSCTASGGWSGALAASGSLSTGALTANSNFFLTCVGPGGTSPAATASVMVTHLPVATASLSASPTSVASGGSSTLTWSSTNATACTASGGWSGSVTASGSSSTGPVSASTVYSLVCTGAGGTSAPATATVNILPTAALSVYPSVIASGGSSTLTWSSTNATSCSASGGWSGALGAGGTKTTGAVTATTTYSLICSGPGGSTLAASATLTVASASMSLAPTAAAITLTRTQQFTATVPGGGAATWTVDAIAGGNSSVGTISSTGLYTAGSTGVHTIVATSAANPTQTATSTVAVTDLAGVYTYHNDVSRDGVNSQEYALTTANVKSSFGKLAACAVDGAIYAQPLWVANVTVNGGPHNVIFVATAHDSLFAIDADSTSCTQLWMVSLIDAAHGATAGETPIPSVAGDALVGAGYGDIQPEIGVTGTPVIDPATGILYVVSKSVGTSQTLFYQRLHAIDITTGNEETGSPIGITATVPGTATGGTTVLFSAKQENQRPGLALANGNVYLAWAAHEDSAPWFGWVMAYQYNGSSFTQTAAFNTAPNAGDGGIWMSGGAPAVDSGGNVYLSTGNGQFDAGSVSPPNNDYGDSLLQLTSSLAVNQYFTPSDEANLFQTDGDFGAGGTALLADLPSGNTVTHALVCGGKDGSLYVLNRDLLGGMGDVFAVQKIALGHGLFSTAALWNGSLFVSPAGGALTAYGLTPSTVQFGLTSVSAHSYSWPGATPSVSATGTQNGLVWALDNHNYCTKQSQACGPAVLHAYDATDLATELWNSSTNSGDAAGYAVKFTVPTVANGRVYVGTRGNNAGGVDSSTSKAGELDIYGLK